MAEPPCPQCGYSRAGLDSAQLCPECGGAPPPPAGVVPIDTADATWLADIRDGLRLVLVACAIGLVTAAFAIALSAFKPAARLSEGAFGLGLVIASILGARGWWVATRPEPFVAISPRRHLIGVAARGSAVGAAAAIGGGAIVVSITNLIGATTISSTLFMAMSVAAAIAVLVHVPAAMAFELHIATLGGDKRLAKSCRQGIWLFPASHAIYGLTAFIPRVEAWIRSFGGSGLISSIFGLLLGIIVAVASLVTLIMPFAYALLTWRAFRHARASIRRREAAEAAARTVALAAP